MKLNASLNFTLSAAKGLIIFLSLILNSHFLIGQTQFQRTFGGTLLDVGNSIIQTTDGGYAAAGWVSTLSSYSNIYIVKLDYIGALQWSRTIGGVGIEYCYSIIRTTDGGYAVAGYRNFSGLQPFDMYIVKLVAGGTAQWSSIIGGTNNDQAYSIIQTTDGGYAIAGVTNSFGAGNWDMYIVKLNASGSLQWNRTVGGTGTEYAWSIIQTTDGGYAVAGNTESFGAGGSNMYIVKLDASGTLQWSRTIGGASDDEARSIIRTADGGYAVAGYTSSFGAGGYDMYTVKLDASGTLQWSKTVGGTNADEAYCIIQTTDGGYAVAGSTSSFGAGYNDFYIVKLDGSGTPQWSKTIGGTNGDYANSIIQTTNGGYAVAGSTGSFGAGQGDMFIVKLDANGNTCANSTSPTSTVTNPTPIVTAPTSTVITPSPTVTTGTPIAGSGGIITTICIVGIQPISNQIPYSYELFQNYPNPFNSSSKIKMQISKLGEVKLVIYDVTGQEVETLVNEELNPGTYEVDWDAANFPSGLYFYRLTSGDYSGTKRMVLIK